MSAPVSDIVNVTISVTPQFPQGQGFGLINIVGNSATLPIGERYRLYSDLASVGLDFSGASEEYKAASIAFSQSPHPSQIAISRRFSSAVAGELLGGLGASQVIGDYTPIATGAFDITVDGVLKHLTGISFVGLTTMNAMAAAVQTVLAAASVGATCVWTGKRFKLTSGTTGAASTISFASAPGAGVDISPLLALRLADGGKTTVGSAVESITQSLQNIQIVNGGWYGFALTAEATEANVQDAAAWAQANEKFYGDTNSNGNNLDASSLVSLGHLLKAAAYGRTMPVYHPTAAYADISAMARLFATDYTARDSTITLMFKTLPGIATVDLDATARAALKGNNMNYYSNFGNSPMFANGVMADGTYADQRHALDALKSALENSVFGYLLTQPKVAQTDKGVSKIVNRLDVACDQFVLNGLIAPGVWEGAPVGTVKTGDFLPKGYYSYAEPVASQPSADRAARKAPPITVIACGAGAIHGVNIQLNYQP